MSDLRAQLQAISESFAEKLLAAVANESAAKVADLRGAIGDALERAVDRALVATKGKPRVAPKPAAPAKAPTRGAKPAVRKAAKPKTRAGAPSKFRVALVKEKVLGYVKAHPNDRSEKIRAALQLDRPIYQRAVKELTADKKIVLKGEKRTTTLTAR